MKSRTEAIAEAIIDIVLDNVMWKKESPYSKLKEYFNKIRPCLSLTGQILHFFSRIQNG